MATYYNPHAPRIGEVAPRGRYLLINDRTMVKQVQATHAPDGREVDVRCILSIVEDVLRRANPSIDGVVNGAYQQHMDTLGDSASLTTFEYMLEALPYFIHKISCEISFECSRGADARSTTMAIFNTLSNYSWDAKMVLALAAFAVNYGEFWLVAQLCTKNSLAKSVGLLKQLPNLLEQYNPSKPQFEAVNTLIKAMLELTKRVIEFKELPSQYISIETPAMAAAMAHIPAAAYWTIRSIVACSTQNASLMGLGDEYIASTTEAWELSLLAHNVSNTHELLKEQIAICHQQINERRQIEAYRNLVHLLETFHFDNMKVLRALIYDKDDILPLVDGSTKTRAHIEVLRKKYVLLLISNLDLSHEEILVLEQMYGEAKATPGYQYEIVWLPIVDSSIAWRDGHREKFEQLQAMMPWYSVHHPSIIEHAVIRYIREMWHFSNKAILVPLGTQGKVLNENAFHMLWIWSNLAFPFTAEREDALWKAESWGLELLADGIDVTILEWMKEQRFICLYGGQDINWIRQFTNAAKAVAKKAEIRLGMVYVGKHDAKERVRKVSDTIVEENLSHCLTDTTPLWFFWARLDSMLYSKLQHGKSVETDPIMQEVMTILSFDGSDQEWAIFFRGATHERARAKRDTAIACLLDFEKWQEDAKQSGFLKGLDNYLQQLHTPHHCNRFILPGFNGSIPERVACAECGRTMEMYCMYRCCVD